MNSDNDINRFLDAQDQSWEGSYSQALDEVLAGQKRTHWIWYVFPQLRGLGRSGHSHFYGITGLSEAERYLQHPILGKRLREIFTALLMHKTMNAVEILGGIDTKKLRSSMTLFDAVSPNDVFNEVLVTFYEGKRCYRTFQMLEQALLK